MSYQPSLKDIGITPTVQTGYRPSLADIPKPNQQLMGSYQIPSYPFVTRPPMQQEQTKAMNELKQFGQGASQSYLNTPEEAANVFGKHLYNKFNYAPQTEAAKLGEMGGDMASYFMPSTVLSSPLKAASLFPKAKAVVNALSTGLKEKPIINALLKGTKNFGEAALYQKEKFPESKWNDVLEAGGIGTALPFGIGMFTSANPIISTLGKLGVGGGLGYMYGGWPGALEGAGAAVTIPKALKEIGINNAPVSTEFLTQPKNPIAQARYEAGNRLGTPLRPSEAFNSTGMARNEGMIPRSESGGKAMSEFGQERLVKQENAIKNLLKTIYPKTNTANNNVKDLYLKSFNNNMPQKTLNNLLKDPLIAEAKGDVASNPVYQRKLKNIPDDNFAYLDQMKRNLNASGKRAARAGDNVAAAEYKDAEKNLVKEMDKISPDYEKARNASQLKIVRRDLEKVLATKQMTGTNLFNTVLRNDTKYQKLLLDLKNNPDSMQQVKDMKLAWEHLIGTETPRAAAGSTARSMTTARNEMIEMWNKYKDLFGAPRDIERAKFIHDPKWWDKFDEVMKYKDKKERIEKLGNLISRGLTPSVLESEKLK